MEPQIQQKQTKAKPTEQKQSAFRVDKTIEVTHVQLVATPMVPGGLVGADLSLNVQKVPGIKMYLQKDGMLWCMAKGQWFIIPQGNVKNYALSKSLEVE